MSIPVNMLSLRIATPLRTIASQGKVKPSIISIRSPGTKSSELIV